VRRPCDDRISEPLRSASAHDGRGAAAADLEPRPVERREAVHPLREAKPVNGIAGRDPRRERRLGGDFGRGG
jgi:hypothetical protein